MAHTYSEPHPLRIQHEGPLLRSSKIRHGSAPAMHAPDQRPRSVELPTTCTCSWRCLQDTKQLPTSCENSKANSSARLRKSTPGFAWQDGYAAISVSPTAVKLVTRYIEQQQEHHRRRSFEQNTRCDPRQGRSATRFRVCLHRNGCRRYAAPGFERHAFSGLAPGLKSKSHCAALPVARREFSFSSKFSCTETSTKFAGLRPSASHRVGPLYCHGDGGLRVRVTGRYSVSRSKGTRPASVMRRIKSWRRSICGVVAPASW